MALYLLLPYIYTLHTHTHIYVHPIRSRDVQYRICKLNDDECLHDVEGRGGGGVIDGWLG